ALVVAHNDTAHPHVHIAVNRVHPERGKAWELDSYIGKGRGRKVDQLHNERVQQYLEAAERQYGWERVRGTYRSGPDLSDERGPSRSEYHREQRKKKQMDVFGMDPEEFDTRSVRLRALEVKDDLFYCESFQALDETLDEQGLWIQAKGQGAVFTDGIHSVKASDINRHLSGPRLEEKFGEDLGAYIEERARHIDSELGYQKLASWTYEMELEELEQLAHIKEGEKEKAEIKEKHFGFLESQFNATLKQLPAAFEQAYEEGEKVYEAFGDYLNEQEGRVEDAVAELVESTERCGVVRDQSGIVAIDEVIREVLAMRGQVKDYVKDISGDSYLDKKKQLNVNVQKAKQELRKVNKKILKHLKSDYRDRLGGRHAEEAQRTAKKGAYKALSLHRRLEKVFSGDGSKRDKELSTFMGNVGLLMTRPGRGSAQIVKQAIKVASQELLKKGRGLERGR